MPLDRLEKVVKLLLVGVFLYLPFSKYGLWFLTPFAFFILLKEKSLRFWLLSGLLFFFLSLRWVHIASHEYGGINTLVSWLLVFLLASVLSLYQFGLSFALWKFLGFKYVFFPFLWVGVELLRSAVPYGGFPWLLTGTVLIDVPVLKFVLVHLGVFGGGLLLLLGVAAFLEKGLKLQVFTLLLALIFSYTGMWKSHASLSPFGDKRVEVAILQPAIPQNVKLSEEGFRKTLPMYISLIEEAIERGAKAVILPESAFYFFISELEYEGKAILELSKKITIIVGMVDVDFKKRIAYNSVVVIDRGAIKDRYDKIKLLPFGEYIPTPFGFAKELFSAIAGIDYIPGIKTEPLNINGLSIATPICFEVAYPGLVKKLSDGADFVAVLTNDAWFKDSDGTYQHMKLAQVRAIENSKYFLWVNNTGPSAVISPLGNIEASLGYMERGILLYSLPVKP